MPCKLLTTRGVFNSSGILRVAPAPSGFCIAIATQTKTMSNGGTNNHRPFLIVFLRSCWLWSWLLVSLRPPAIAWTRYGARKYILILWVTCSKARIKWKKGTGYLSGSISVGYNQKVACPLFSSPFFLVVYPVPFPLTLCHRV